MELMHQLGEMFAVSGASIRQIAAGFKNEMFQGLKREAGSLKMLPSFLPPPSGREAGRFLALDLGGTNLRAALVELGNRQPKSLKSKSIPLVDRDSGYDYRCGDAVELFALAAGLLAEIIEPGRSYHLGFTFSFPCLQTGLTEVKLLSWTKQFTTSGVVGQDVGGLLQAALCRRSLPIKISAVLNDTVGTLLTAAYSEPQTLIGSILGTGHNTCYLEAAALDRPMFINIEAGNFSGLQESAYDADLDRQSANPGQQRLEKMVAGKYLGEIFRLVCSDLILGGSLFKPGDASFFALPYSLSGEDLSIILSDASPALAGIERWLSRTGIGGSALTERKQLQLIAGLIIKRSARMVAGSYLGILQYLDPPAEVPVPIAIDGSLYAKMPGYRSHLADALSEVLPEKGPRVRIKFYGGGSQTGAAIAAAIAASGRA